MNAGNIQNIVVLTGAGISAESGLSTFRDENGLWCQHRIEDVATPEGFARDPALVHNFYNMRRTQLRDVQPNAAHHALAELAERWHGNFMLVTQNVDDLHGRAINARKPADGFSLVHMHGELKKIRCLDCDKIMEWEEELDTLTPCPSCKDGSCRPHIVWFGEMPMEMERIYDAIARCDLFISIGTSGNVYPAAGFVADARHRGRARCVELNLEPSSGSMLFHEAIHGPATKIVPEYIEKLIA